MKIYKSLFLSFFLFSCDGFNEEIVPININVEDVESILVINGEIGPTLGDAVAVN